MLMLPPSICNSNFDIIPSLIAKLKNLEILGVGISFYEWTVEIFKLIGSHLPNFVGLFITSRYIDDYITLAIVVLLPKLKQLFINQARISKENIILIMQSCEELMHLEARNCIGFDEDDEDILKHSSTIKNFRCDGSRSFDDFYDGYVDVYDGTDSD